MLLFFVEFRPGPVENNAIIFPFISTNELVCHN